MGVLSLVHAPGRYANLRRIRSLDPEVDHDEILRLTARFEFPWDYSQGTGIAFMRDYGVPSIAASSTARGSSRTTASSATTTPSSSATRPPSTASTHRARTPRCAGSTGSTATTTSPTDEFAYVLATTIVGPVRWIEAYGWRRLDDHELVAITKVTTRFGELMGIKDLPTTYDGYLALLVDYERRHFAHTPAATRLAEASIRIAPEVAPAPLRPLLRRVTIAVMDEPLREALGLPRQPRWFVRAVRGGLRLRGRLLRLAPPRRTAYVHRPTHLPARLPARGPRPDRDARRAQPVGVMTIARVSPGPVEQAGRAPLLLAELGVEDQQRAGEGRRRPLQPRQLAARVLGDLGLPGVAVLPARVAEALRRRRTPPRTRPRQRR